MFQKGFAPIITVILGVVVVLGTVGGYLFFTNQPLPLIQPFLQSEAPPSPSPLDQSQEQTASSTSQPSPTSKEVAKIPILSTINWQEISFNGIKFKIPPESSFREKVTGSAYPDDPNDAALFWTSATMVPQRVTVEPYQGGSRRSQFLKGINIDYCKPLYEEALFGTVNALQIAIDGDECQGGGGGIVTVVGDKLVIFHDLFYPTDTKIIHRYDKRDTVISTVTTN